MYMYNQSVELCSNYIKFSNDQFLFDVSDRYRHTHIIFAGRGGRGEKASEGQCEFGEGGEGKWRASYYTRYQPRCSDSLQPNSIQ